MENILKIDLALFILVNVHIIKSLPNLRVEMKERTSAVRRRSNTLVLQFF